MRRFAPKLSNADMAKAECIVVRMCKCACARAHDTVSARVSLTYMSVESCNNCKSALLSACKSKWLVYKCSCCFNLFALYPDAPRIISALRFALCSCLVFFFFFFFFCFCFCLQASSFSINHSTSHYSQLVSLCL